MKRFKQILSTTILFFLLTPLFPLPTYASTSDFKLTTNYDITYEQENDYVTIEEELIIDVLNPKYYYPKGGENVFSLPDFDLVPDESERGFKIDSLEITNIYDLEQEYTLEQTIDGIVISVPILNDIKYSERYTINIVYNTHELININGNITNFYIPGLIEDIEFTETNESGLRTEYEYNTILTIPKDMPDPSHIEPSSIVRKNKQDTTTYTISQEDRLGTTGWLQIGSSQYYYFRIEQDAPKTDTFTPQGISEITNLLSTNIYKIALPREFDEIEQTVFFTNITPSPTRIERDEEGNLIATFEVSANEDNLIIIEGYISLYQDHTTTTEASIPYFNLTDYRNNLTTSNLTQYLLADQYWEINDPIIRDLSNELLSQADTIEELITLDYNYIVDNFDYSYAKAEGVNERLGAKAALSGANSICMEYADTLVALLRAQGIPARSALGYGNDPTGAENQISNTEALIQNIGHQWVQVWIPDYGWLSVDPTWGETGRKYIGSDLDHILWYTQGSSNQLISDTLLYSADSLTSVDITNYRLYIQALTKEEFNDVKITQTVSDLIQKYEEVDENSTGFFLKTTILGRGLIMILPILTTLIVVTIITTSISAVIKKKKIQRVMQ